MQNLQAALADAPRRRIVKLEGAMRERDARQSHRDCVRWGTPMARLVMAASFGFALAACSSPPRDDEAPKTPSLRVASAALASGAPDVALRVADITLAKQPKDVAALIAKGDALYDMGETEVAKAAYRSAIALDPNAAAAQLGLGRTLVKSDPIGAELAFLAALRTDATSVTALNDLGVARDLEGHYSQAQEAYHLALALSPNSDDIKINLGRSLAAAGHSADAVTVLRQVAANPQAVQQWHDQLVAALTLAGDDAWAQHALGNDPYRPAAPAQQGPSLAALDSSRPSTASPVTVAVKPSDMPLAGMPSSMHGPANLDPYVQLAALPSASEAMREWQRLGRRSPEILSGREPTITQADVAGKKVWRLRMVGFATIRQARDLCTRLQTARLSCWYGRGL
jgi:Flp pilus assembly protein TadD